MSQYLVGGTAIGIKTKDFVVLASDKMYLSGNFAFSNEVKKLYKISPKAFLAASGLIADMQELIREVKYIVGTRRVLLGRDVNVKSIAKIVSVILYGNKAFPMYTQLLVGGYDVSPHLYSLDSLGSVMSDDYVAIGSGSETAIGIIENEYSSNLSEEELESLILKAFKSVARRDVLTGFNIDMVLISKDGYKEKTLTLVKS